MIYRFAGCTLDTDRQRLTRDGNQVSVEPQVYDLIHLIVTNPDRLITRDEIIDTVWNGRIVSESAISARIASARKAVGDDGKSQSIFRTIARRGLEMAAKVSSEGATPAVAKADIPPPLPRIRYATAPDGFRLAYSVSGSGSSVLRASHSYSHLESEWSTPSEAPMLHALSANHTLLRTDERGSGLSTPSLTVPSPQQVADDMIVCADAAGLDQFAVYSESGGCFDAITLAASYPDRVSKLILCGGYADGSARRSGNARSEPLRELFLQGWDTPRSPFIAASMAAYFPEGPHDIVREMAAFTQTTMNAEKALALRDRISHGTVAGLLGQISAPTLIIHSRHDPIHPLSEGQKLAAGIPNAELTIYDTANHMPIPGHHLWDRLVTDVLSFLAED